MQEESSDQSSQEFLLNALGPSSSFAPRRLSSPLAGVAVSERGFVALVSSGEAELSCQRAFALVVSVEDRARVSSAEALTLLQLLHGIDLAGPLLPPSALSDAFPPPSPSLRAVRIAPAPSPQQPSPAPVSPAAGGGPSAEVAGASAGRLAGALAGLGVEVSEERARELLRRFGDEEAQLTRDSFARLVAEARAPVFGADSGGAELFLVAADAREHKVGVLTGLGLHLRHKAPLDIHPKLFQVGSGSLTATEALAAFPTLQRTEAMKAEGMAMAEHTARMFQEARDRLDLEQPDSL